MPYLIKHTSTEKWVANSGSKHSYTDDISQAVQFRTAKEVQKEACLVGESIWFFPAATLGRLVTKKGG